MRALAVALVVLLIAIPASAKDDPRPAQADCKGANLDDPTDPVCGRKEASLSNAVAYAYIKSMSARDRIDAEQFYLSSAIRCFSHAVWADHGGVSGAEGIFLDISNQQCSTEFSRYIRLCTFNNTGRLISDVQLFRDEMQVCWNVFFRAAWEDASGISVSLGSPNDLRVWYMEEMRRAGRPRN